MYGWSTLPYQMEDSYQDIVNKCDLELVFLKCWAFGEVKKIQGPTGAHQAVNCPNTVGKATQRRDTTSADKDVIPGSDPDPDVIPGNAQRKSNRSTKQTLPAPPKKVTQHSSTRKCQTVDYSILDDSTDTLHLHVNNTNQIDHADHQELC